MLGEMSGDLEEEAGEIRLEERLVAPLVMALARLLREAEESADGAERQKTILDVGRQLSQLRRESHQAQRVRMEQERWEEKQSEICQREYDEAQKEARRQALWERTKAEFPALRPREELEAEYEALRKPRGRGKGKGRVKRARAKQEEGLKEQKVGQKARPHPNPLPQERELATAAPGESNQIKPNQTCQKVPSSEFKVQSSEGSVGEDGG